MGISKKSISINYSTQDNINEFNILEKELILKTIDISKNAYAPYSKFEVSSGILLDDKTSFFGTNVENAAYPVGVCAERNVLANVTSNHPDKKIISITIYAHNTQKALNEFVSPCGMCRQAILEAEVHQKSPINIILIGPENRFIIFEKALDLLPMAFTNTAL